MYILDEQTKRLVKAEECSFKELGFKERQDLQEWIAHEPSSLGEDLLIIQKEFDGFSDTRERLDLLALDKFGHLVVIENKLDDSGRDVTWQAVKYASYCSSLDKQEIVRIYQDYLNKYESGNASDKLVEFFDRDWDEIEINPDNTQRIILVAANFHKEVTSSVLWLNSYGLNIKCYQVTPHKFNNRVLIDFDQIIPTQGAEDYQIKVASKKREEAVQSKAKELRYNDRYAFWNAFIEYNKQHNGPYAESKCTTDSWMGKGLGKSIPGASLNIVIAQNVCRTEVYLNNGTQERNKEVFDKLYAKKNEFEAQISGLVWERLDEKVTCRIRLDYEHGYRDTDDFEKTFAFLMNTTNQMMQVFTDISKGIKFGK